MHWWLNKPTSAIHLRARKDFSTMKVCPILNKKVGFLILGLTFLNLYFQDANGQTTLLLESFETDGDGSRYN